MTSDSDFADIARMAYRVDPLWQDPPEAKGTQFPQENPRYVVISDPASDPVTGFQGMAVAPLVDGLPDYSQVHVSFAGTNPGHHADISADAQIVLGQETASATQAGQALAYAEKVRADVLRENPDATFSTVGHSLGGYLALYVAGELEWTSTTFNAPDPWNAMTPHAQQWRRDQLDAGTLPWRNFVNEWDPIANFDGNGTGAAIYVTGEPGKDPLSYHNLETGFPFNADGAITTTGDGRSTYEITENLLSGFPASVRPVPAAALSQLLTVLRDPVVGASVGSSVSAIMIAVDTIASAALASTILKSAEHLTQLKQINSGLIPQMQRDLDDAKRAAIDLPYITEADIENCVTTHRLRVHDNIDEDAVDTVNRRIDDHLDTVQKLFDGINTAIRNATAQDEQWASVYRQSSANAK
ncbi:hypothetical protein ACIRCZ_05035 [Leifsonia sp. NPDC102414]|uniref:hypothetical protein n=1 Tax=Leifsonia sp. NPDC102414 TaxID=3364124 RepID=UPI00380F1446